MIFSEATPYVGDDFKGDTLVLVSNTGGRKDKHFSRNYAWAKHAADRGTVKTIIVKVHANGEAYRTIDAFKRAVSRPHPATRVQVDGSFEHASAILEAITAIVPSASAKETPAAPVQLDTKPSVPALKVDVPATPVKDVPKPGTSSTLFKKEDTSGFTKTKGI